MEAVPTRPERSWSSTTSGPTPIPACTSTAAPGCGAVTAAYTAATEGEWPEPPGVRRRVEPLVPVVERGLSGPVDPDREDVVDALVEHNVREQVAFLDSSDEVPEDTTTFGFVYDLHGTFGGPKGRVYLVSVDGETGTETLTERAEDRDEHVASLL